MHEPDENQTRTHRGAPLGPTGIFPSRCEPRQHPPGFPLAFGVFEASLLDGKSFQDLHQAFSIHRNGTLERLRKTDTAWEKKGGQILL